MTPSTNPTLRLAALLLLGAVASCSEPGEPKTVFGGDRPVTLKVPSTYDPGAPAPLLIVLHGYGFDGAVQEAYFGAASLVESHGVLLASPDGTLNSADSRFWNGTDFCCDFEGTNVDDVGYLRGLIEEIQAEYAVDPKRIFLMGHSNGGFMAYRMACDAADLIAGIVSLAGATWSDPDSCVPSEPVSILQVHGTDDATILFNGGSAGGASYPGALESASQWAGYDGCAATTTAGTALDIDANVPGEETTADSHDACPASTGVTLWSIEGGGHVPAVLGTFAPTAWTWLAEHPKP